MKCWNEADMIAAVLLHAVALREKTLLRYSELARKQ